jgi:hypothetical protein
MKNIDLDRKAEVIAEYFSTESISETARRVKVSRNTVRLWVNRFLATRKVTQPARSTCRPAMSKEAAKTAKDMLVKKEGATTRSVARSLHAMGLTKRALHGTTISRHAKKAAKADGTTLQVKRGRPPKALTQATKSKRLKFARANRSRMWAVVLFTDRKRFLLSYPGSKVRMIRWVEAGPEAEEHLAVYQPNHPQSVNIYAGITKYGVTRVHVVAGSSKHTSNFHNKKGQPAKNITAEEYRHVLSSTLLPEGRRLFSTQGISTWVLQQDNDPTHSVAGAEVKVWNQKHGSSVQLLENWPPNSPDLNLIENVWGLVQEKVNAAGCSSFDEFKLEVERQFQAVSKTMLRNLFASMPKRLAKVIELGGGKTKH